jgi:hypothetical protein
MRRPFACANDLPLMKASFDEHVHLLDLPGGP